MIALPNIDGSFTCTLFWPFEGANSFASLGTGREVVRFFESTFPDAAPLMPDLAEEYFRNPTGSLVTIGCSPWHEAGRVVLLGDACHAVVPFHGQGANAAFEDCIVLRDCLREHLPDLAPAFAAFEARRKAHTDALAALSIANFEEMRDHTASRLFRARKSLEKGLHRLFPSWYIPLYMMVAFTRIPYADAVRRERRQQRLVGISAVVMLLLLTLALLLWIHGGF
jgi:kynurenine 3-monooxygenase